MGYWSGISIFILGLSPWSPYPLGQILLVPMCSHDRSWELVGVFFHPPWGLSSSDSSPSIQSPSALPISPDGATGQVWAQYKDQLQDNPAVPRQVTVRRSIFWNLPWASGTHQAPGHPSKATIAHVSLARGATGWLHQCCPLSQPPAEALPAGCLGLTRFPFHCH